MSIVSCPRCGDKVSVPPAASTSALVQCPLCLEEYFLSDALVQLPPMLVVVGGHAAAGEKEGEYRLAEPVAAAISEAEFGASGGTAVAARPQLRPVSRRRPQEKSAIGELVKVVLGGMAGLAGGLLVLWWGFGVDVGDLGPTVSKVQYLRFLVPPKLRAQTVPPGNESSQLDTMNAESGQGRGDAKQQSGEDGTGGDSQPASDGDKAQGKPATGKENKKGNKPPEEDPFAALDLPGAKPAAGDAPELKIDDPLSAIKPKEEDKPKRKEKPPATEPEGGGGGFFGKGRPPTQAVLGQRLAQAVEAVNQSIDALEDVNRDDSAAADAALRYVYDMAARLATAALEIDRSAAEFTDHRQTLDDCLRRLAGDPRRTNVIRQRARVKLEDAANNGSWILIAGTVKDVRSAGDWFETMVDATDDGRFAAVLTTEDPQGTWRVNDQVVVLGRVLRDPADNAKGYQGDAEVAVTSAHSVTTGGAAPPTKDTPAENKDKKSETSPVKEDKPASDAPKSDEPKPAEKDPE
jgi:hypothetical protein